MKTTLAALMLSAVATLAQTYVNVPLTNFVPVAPSYAATTTVTVPTNTLAKIIAIQTAGGINSVLLSVQNPGLPPVPADWVTDDVLNTPFLGPCNIVITAKSTTQANTLCMFLVQFNAVNGASFPGESLIQPTGANGLVSLQTSTNLTDWQTITNAAFPKAGANRFFRTTLATP